MFVIDAMIWNVKMVPVLCIYSCAVNSMCYVKNIHFPQAFLFQAVYIWLDIWLYCVA